MASSRKRSVRPARKPSAQSVFAEMDSVIRSCRAALLSSDFESIRRRINSAKKRYALALRHAAPVAFTMRDVRTMDSKSAELENLISRLEALCAALRADFKTPG